MNFKIYLLSVVFIITCGNILVSQEVIPDEVVVNQTDEKNNIYENSTVIKKEPKVNYKVNLGTGFSTSYFGNAFSTYAAPEVRYALAPKLNISAGFLVTNTTVSDYYIASKENRNNFTNAYAFVGADYQATERLRISGEILYGMNKSPYSFNGNRGSDYYLRFSAEYKITENLSVGLQVINQNMGYPNYNDPLNNDPFRRGYYNPYYPFSRF